MKLMTYQRYTYKARLFDYSVANDTNGTLVYEDKGDVDIEFATDPNAPRVVIYCREPLRRKVQLQNVRNHRGESVLGNNTYAVTSIEPVLTVFGDLEGYRMQAASTQDGY